MTIKDATPYLFFNGRATEAAKHYEQTLGAKIETLQTFGAVDESCPDADKDRVMHALLTLGQSRIMLSDGPSSQPVAEGAQVQVALDYDDLDDMQKAFAALAETGKVGMPIQDTFWGAKFGFLSDRFGIHWMFNWTKPTG